MSKKATDEAIFEFATFLVTSARGLFEEPQIYGTFRLLDALTRLVEMCRRLEWCVPDVFLEQVQRGREENSGLVMSDLGGYKKFVDELVRDFAKELKRRSHNCSKYDTSSVLRSGIRCNRRE